MGRISEGINAFISDIFGMTIPDVHVTDIVEIFIIAFFIHRLLIWFKNTRAWTLFRGIMIIVVFFGVAAIFQMHTILWLGEKLFSAGIMALIVVFQPELRKALEQLGRKNFTNVFSVFGIGRNAGKRFEDKTIVDLTTACYEMAAVKTGALIVVEQEDELTEFERTGIKLDSLLSKQLLINIFEKNTPLHDGAIIVRHNRVVSATCYLPLSDNMSLSKELGTRHRAAIGVSEVTDALVIVVSEETGKVSVAKDGMLYRDIDDEKLIQELKRLQIPQESDSVEEGKTILGRRVKHEK